MNRLICPESADQLFFIAASILVRHLKKLSRHNSVQILHEPITWLIAGKEKGEKSSLMKLNLLIFQNMQNILVSLGWALIFLSTYGNLVDLLMSPWKLQWFRKTAFLSQRKYIWPKEVSNYSFNLLHFRALLILIWIHITAKLE